MVTKILRIAYRLFQILLLVAGIGIALSAIPAYRSEYEEDHSVANLKAIILVVFGSAMVVVSLALLPRLRWTIRLFILACPLLLSLVFLALFRPTGFSGEMLPSFAWRWSKVEPPYSLRDGKPMLTFPDSNLADEFDFSKLRFDQFLGPNRNGRIDGVSIDADWGHSQPKLLWKHSIGAGWSGLAIQGRRVVTMEQRWTQEGSEEWTTCYDLLTGDLLWKQSQPAEHSDPIGGRGPRSTPLIASGAVYCQGATGIVQRLRLDDGQLEWVVSLLELGNISQEESLAQIAWGRSGSPVLVGNQIVLPLGGNHTNSKSLVALDANSGQVVWSSGEDSISYASPILVKLSGVEQLVTVNESTVSGTSPVDGSVLWSYPWEGSSSGAANISVPVVIGESRLLLSKGYGVGASLVEVTPSSGDPSPLSASKVWANHHVLKTKFTNAVIQDGYAYGLSDGILECVDLATGSRAWKKGRYGQGQLLLVGKHLLILAEDGRLVLVNASHEEFQQLAEFPVLEGTTWNIPAMVGPLVVVRNAQEMACIQLPCER